MNARYVVLFVIVAILMVLAVIASPKSRAPRGACRTNADCPAGKYCTSAMTPDGISPTVCLDNNLAF